MLRTRRLALTPCRPEDRADFIGLERDPEVMRFLNGGQAVDRERSDPDATFLMPEGTETYVWTARCATTRDFVGWFCLWPAGGGAAELGFRLRRRDWGQGLASEGAAALVGWGFGTGGYDRITAVVLAGNHASRRVLEKVGLRNGRIVAAGWQRPFPGSEAGDVEYALTRTEWNGS